MDKTLDLDELEKDAHGVLAYHNPSDPTPRVGVRATVLLTLIAAARPAVVSDEVVDLKADLLKASEYETVQGEYQHFRTLLRRAALALLPGGVPDGWVLVPREPTREMIKSGQGAADDKYWLWRGLGERPVGSGLDGMALYVDAAYRAMLSASPKGSPRSLPSRTAQEPPSPTPCDLEGGDQ